MPHIALYILFYITATTQFIKPGCRVKRTLVKNHFELISLNNSFKIHPANYQVASLWHISFPLKSKIDLPANLVKK